MAHSQENLRTEMINNDQVHVWQTRIPAGAILPMHHHPLARVVVAQTNGKLKITDATGKAHYWSLHRGKSYYFPASPKGERHQDENVTDHLIVVTVIELKK